MGLGDFHGTSKLESAGSGPYSRKRLGSGGMGVFTSVALSLVRGVSERPLSISGCGEGTSSRDFGSWRESSCGLCKGNSDDRNFSIFLRPCKIGVSNSVPLSLVGDVSENPPSITGCGEGTSSRVFDSLKCFLFSSPLR